ncbi:C40 family peptidase [Claveliimonas sp.]|uniref:C40 family peptidase n=1 Tax=Claveliimonas sp. TaxID=3076672 RepID=UPI00307BB24E
MNSNLKRGLFLVTLAGVISISGETAKAADSDKATEAALPNVGIEAVLNDCYASDEKINVESYLVPTEKGEYSDMAFTNVGTDTFLFVRSEPTTQSEWVGKLYTDYAAQIIGPVGEWTKIRSGSVTGYVYTDYIIIGNKSQQKAQELIQNSEGQTEEEAFRYAESRQEEEERLAREAAEAAAAAQERAEAERQAREAAAAKAAQAASSIGQAIVDYACQFVGNPYVWGGTSLTNGADCSGFVQSVYAHFGISLPRTTWDQENVGTGISYDQALPGDLILYEGHVGIYMGDGQIVNAINPSKGIGVIPATCMSIKTVRRVL